MNNRMHTKEELYNLSLSNIHKYPLLNEIFAIRDERFPKEQQATMLCVNGYISIDLLDRHKRNIDELVTYQNIGTIKEFKDLQQENKELKERIDKAKEYIDKHISYECDDVISGMRFCSHHLIYDFRKEDLLEILGEENE